MGRMEGILRRPRPPNPFAWHQAARRLPARFGVRSSGHRISERPNRQPPHRPPKGESLAPGCFVIVKAYAGRGAASEDRPARQGSQARPARRAEPGEASKGEASQVRCSTLVARGVMSNLRTHNDRPILGLGLRCATDSRRGRGHES